jgi:hypothetical protein
MSTRYTLSTAPRYGSWTGETSLTWLVGSRHARRVVDPTLRHVAAVMSGLRHAPHAWNRFTRIIRLMLRPRLVVSFCVVCSLSACGCDPVRTTLQHVRLQVTKSDSGQPVDGALVWLRYDFERGSLWSKDPSSRRYWEHMPWYCGVTDGQGKVKVGIEYTVLDRTIGPRPPAWRDEVTGQPYLMKVSGGQPQQEEFSLIVKPGVSVKGKSFEVSIREIDRPRYVGPD